MKTAVIGAGAIGSLVAGYLKLKGQDVVLVGRKDCVNAVRTKGLEVSGVRGNFNIKVDAQERLNFDPGLLILATKTQDIEQALKDNVNYIRNSTLLTTQNGARADEITSRIVPKENIVSSIVMFGSTYLEPAKVVHNFEGSWILGRSFQANDEHVVEISGALDAAFPTIISEDIRGMKYLKIFVNANNCIPAILGVSMQEAFSDLGVSRISMGIWKEALGVVREAGIGLESLPDFPLERMEKLAAMPGIESAKIFSSIMTNLSKEPLYGSILQSIKRGRESEIDYINGEFVRLAKEIKRRAPLNEKLVEMVHRVEKTKRFFTKQELIQETKSFLV